MDDICNHNYIKERCLGTSEIQPARHNVTTAVFGPKFLIFKGGSKTFATLIMGNLLDTCFVWKILTGEAPMGRWRRKSAILTPKFWYLGQNQFFALESWFFVKRAYHQYTQGYPEKFFHPEKVFCFWGRGHFPGLIPEFGFFRPFLYR